MVTVADDVVHHQTRREPQEEHREDDRHKGHDLLLHRVGHGGRRHLLDEEHGRAHDDRQDVVRVLRGQVMDPQDKRRMTQFNRGAQHVVQRKEDWHLNNQREAATQRVNFSALYSAIISALTLFIVAQTLAHCLNLRLQHTHLRHGGVLRFSQRVHDATNDKGDDDNREAPVAEEAVDEFQQLKQRLGDEPQPAVVYGQIQCGATAAILSCRAGPTHSTLSSLSV